MPAPEAATRWNPAEGETPPRTWPCKICRASARLEFTRVPGPEQIIEAAVLPKGYERPYYRCPRCGLFFHPAFESLPEAHRDVYELPGMGDALDRQVNRARREVVMVDAFLRLHGLPRSAKILVFGCGSGLSYNYLLGSGFNAYATDLSIQFESAAEVFVDHGFRRELVPDMLRRFRRLEDMASGSVDIIAMTEVFEHLLDPVDMMGRLAGLLRPGGLAVGTTGWVDRVTGELRDWWYLKCLSHATFLSSEGFRRLCAATGCLGTLYPNTRTLRGDTGMHDTQCFFAMQRPL